MDSVSQIVLGAAVGEAVLGKKLGNKAMFWGAVGGTIPDLDIITKPVMTELQSLAFHRGISHSFVFAIVAGLAFGWLIHRLYESDYARNFFQLILSLFMSAIPISITFFLFGNDWNPYLTTAVVMAVAGVFYKLLSRNNASMPVSKENVPLRSWQWMFFWAFATHALLDTFTMYGTQLFLPFSDYRAAFGSISVADPLGYTLPFIACLIMVSIYNRESPKRRFWVWLGLGLSCGYLIFTLWHKERLRGVYERQLAEQGIVYDRLMLGPTIFNNFLWSATVESKDRYYQGQYSIFDTSPIKFVPIEKNRDLIAGSEEDNTIQTLRWFSNDYYNVIRRSDGRLQMNDLRFGTFTGDGGEDDFIFRFFLRQREDGSFLMEQSRGGPDDDEVTDLFGLLYNRIKGV